MRIDFDTMNKAMNDISDRLIVEALPGSGELKNSAVRRITTAAASFVIICLGAIFAILAATKVTPPVTPSATITQTDTASATVETHAAETETDGPQDSESAAPEVGNPTTVFKVNGESFTLEYIESADPEGAGEITGVSILSVPSGYEAKIVDTAGVYADIMMIELTVGSENFAVLCNIRTGEVNDFMRETEYGTDSDSWMDRDSWSLVFPTCGTVTWRVDGSGVVFAAVCIEDYDIPNVYPGLMRLWAFDTVSGTLYDCALSSTRGDVDYYGGSLTVLRPDDPSDPCRSIAVMWQDRTSLPGGESKYELRVTEPSFIFPGLPLDTSFSAEIPDKDGDTAIIKAETGGETKEYSVVPATGKFSAEDSAMPPSGKTEFEIGSVTVSVDWKYDGYKRNTEDVTVTGAQAFGADGARHEVTIPYETFGTEKILLAVDGTDYAVCNVLTGEVLRFSDYESAAENVPDEVKAKIDGDYTPNLRLIDSYGTVYIALESEIGTFGGAQHAILCGEWIFDTLTGTLAGGAPLQNGGRIEFTLMTPGGKYLIWVNGPDGPGVLRTPADKILEAMSTEDYPPIENTGIDIDKVNKKIVIYGETVDISRVAMWDSGSN